MPKNLGLYNDNLSVPRKQDVDLVNSELEQLTQDFDEHIGNFNNPHQVTPEKIGALPTQNGSKGQFLGFVEENVVGAIDAPTTLNIQISSEQPSNQKTGDFWYQIV